MIVKLNKEYKHDRHFVLNGVIYEFDSNDEIEVDDKYKKSFENSKRFSIVTPKAKPKAKAKAKPVEKGE